VEGCVAGGVYQDIIFFRDRHIEKSGCVGWGVLGCAERVAEEEIGRFVILFYFYPFTIYILSIF
jgi:hypothetical protein